MNVLVNNAGVSSRALVLAHAATPKHNGTHASTPAASSAAPLLPSMPDYHEWEENERVQRRERE